MKIRTLFLGLIFLALHSAAHAQLFKCKGANGRYTFQNAPCPSNDKLPDIKRPVPGENDPSFAQRNKDKRPDANWLPRVAIPTEPPLAPMQAAAPSPVHSARPVTGAAAAGSWQKQEQDFQKRRAEEQGKAAQDQVKANKLQRECTRARQQLAVLNESRPVYSRDSKGEKQYVLDQNRPAEIAAATRRVAEACN